MDTWDDLPRLLRGLKYALRAEHHERVQRLERRIDDLVERPVE